VQLVYQAGHSTGIDVVGPFGVVGFCHELVGGAAVVCTGGVVVPP
jgi:hypothetical protein